jgi:hypothetical protein
MQDRFEMSVKRLGLDDAEALGQSAPLTTEASAQRLVKTAAT